MTISNILQELHALQQNVERLRHYTPVNYFAPDCLAKTQVAFASMEQQAYQYHETLGNLQDRVEQRTHTCPDCRGDLLRVLASTLARLQSIEEEVDRAQRPEQIGQLQKEFDACAQQMRLMEHALTHQRRIAEHPEEALLLLNQLRPLARLTPPSPEREMLDRQIRMLENPTTCPELLELEKNVRQMRNTAGKEAFFTAYTNAVKFFLKELFTAAYAGHNLDPLSKRLSNLCDILQETVFKLDVDGSARELIQQLHSSLSSLLQKAEERFPLHAIQHARLQAAAVAPLHALLVSIAYEPVDLAALAAAIRQLPEAQREHIYLNTWILDGRPWGDPHYGEHHVADNLKNLKSILQDLVRIEEERPLTTA
jgi:hypothetical protein